MRWGLFLLLALGSIGKADEPVDPMADRLDEAEAAALKTELEKYDEQTLHAMMEFWKYHEKTTETEFRDKLSKLKELWKQEIEADDPRQGFRLVPAHYLEEEIVAFIKTGSQSHEMPWPSRVKPGDCGYLSTVQVLSVAGPHDAIVNPLHFMREVHIEGSYWLTGLDTSQLASESKIHPSGAWYASGTKTYETAIGGSRTVMKLVKVPTELVEKSPHAEKFRSKLQGEFDAILKEHLDKLFQSRLRTWTSKDGSHTTQAAYVSQKGTSVRLVKKDGESIEVSSAELSKSDRSWLGTQRRRERKELQAQKEDAEIQAEKERRDRERVPQRF